MRQRIPFGWTRPFGRAVRSAGSLTHTTNVERVRERSLASNKVLVNVFCVLVCPVLS